MMSVDPIKFGYSDENSKKAADQEAGEGAGGPIAVFDVIQGMRLEIAVYLSVRKIPSLTCRRITCHNTQFQVDAPLGRLPSWYLGRNPSKRVIAVSHTQRLAETFSRRVRNHISSSMWPFPGFRSPQIMAVSACGPSTGMAEAIWRLGLVWALPGLGLTLSSLTILTRIKLKPIRQLFVINYGNTTKGPYIPEGSRERP